jgi:hypothetical protein
MKMKKNILGLAVLLSVIPLFALDVCITSYGGYPDDGVADHVAFRNALDAIVAAGGGTLRVLPGTYDMNARQTINLIDRHVAIIGSGKGVTSLRCNNATGIWWFNNSLNHSQLTLRDLTFVAGAEGNSGTAIQINNPSLSPSGLIKSLHMERIDFDVKTRGTDYFFRHIFTSYLRNPVFIDVFVTSLGRMEQSESGFRINYGHGATFENCYSKDNGTGFLLTNYKGDILFNRCIAVGNNTGIQITALPDEECTVAVPGLHANTHETNLAVYRATQVLVENAASYTSTTNAFTDFYIWGCSNVDIVGCEFHQPFAETRTMVHLAGTTRDVLIQQNIFNGVHWNGRSGITDVRMDSGVTNVTQQDNLSPPAHQW